MAKKTAAQLKADELKEVVKKAKAKKTITPNQQQPQQPQEPVNLPDPPAETPQPPQPPQEPQEPVSPPEPVPPPEQTAAPKVGADARRISVFEDLAAPTEEDAGQKDRMESSLEMLTDTDDFPEEPAGDGGEDDPRVKKELAKINASVIVELMDVLFMLLCMWASGDWSENAQKSYTLVPQRKKAIQIPLFQLLMRRKKKTNPTAAIVFLILGSYTPMIILAVMRGIKQKREKAEQQEKENSAQAQINALQQQLETARQQARQQQAQAAFNASNPGAASNVPTYIAPAPVFSRAGKTRGRHLWWCVNKENKSLCSCKGYVHKPGCPGLKGKRCNCKTV